MDIGVTGGVNRDIGAINFYGQNDTTDNYIGIFSYYDRNNYPQFTFRSVYDVNVGQGFLEFIAYQVNSGLRVLETGAVITTSFGSTRNTLDDGDGGASFAGGNVGIDSSGNLTASGSIKGGGFNSSDGSAGITGTFTTASLVGKTVTFKNGLITGFA
jgi:hypothetical protein